MSSPKHPEFEIGHKARTAYALMTVSKCITKEAYKFIFHVHSLRGSTGSDVTITDERQISYRRMCARVLLACVSVSCGLVTAALS